MTRRVFGGARLALHVLAVHTLPRGVFRGAARRGLALPGRELRLARLIRQGVALLRHRGGGNCDQRGQREACGKFHGALLSLGHHQRAGTARVSGTWPPYSAAARFSAPNAGITSRAKRRRFSREPAGPLSSTCVTPAACNRSSFSATSSGVPNSVLSAAASSVWSNDSIEDLPVPAGSASFAMRCWFDSRASTAFCLSAASFAT